MDMDVINEIKTLRKNFNISLRSLAEVTQLNYVYINRLENGLIKNPSKEILGKIAQGFSKLIPYFEVSIGEVYPNIKRLAQWAASNEDTDELQQEEVIERIEEDIDLAKEEFQKHWANIEEAAPSRLQALRFIQAMNKCLPDSKAEFESLLFLLESYSTLNFSYQDLLKEFCLLLASKQSRDKRRTI